MMLRGLPTIMYKEFIHLRRDPATLVLTLFIPVLQLVLFGYAINTDVKNIPTVVYDLDRGRQSREMVTALRNTEYFRIARGTVIGIGSDARVAITNRLSVSGRLMQYFHTGTTGMASPNWNQTRALFQVDWVMGANADRVAGYR